MRSSKTLAFNFKKILQRKPFKLGAQWQADGLESADRKTKLPVQKGSLSPKHSSQHLTNIAKIFFSMPQLGMVIYARKIEKCCSHAAKAGESSSSSQDHNISVVCPKMLHFWTIWEVPAGLSLVPEPGVASIIRKGRA